MWEQEDDTLIFDHIFSSTFRKCSQKRNKISIFQYDTSYWDTPISIREIIINKQLDFIKKEMTKYRAIRYVHHHEMGIPVSCGEDGDKPFLLGQTWFFTTRQRRALLQDLVRKAFLMNIINIYILMNIYKKEANNIL